MYSLGRSCQCVLSKFQRQHRTSCKRCAAGYRCRLKHRLKLSDEETVAQIQENPYLQYFCGLKGFSIQAPFAPSLLVEIRKRMGIDVFEQLHQAIINQLERSTPLTDPKTGGNNASPELTGHTSEAEASTEAAVDSTESDVISDEK